MATRPEGPTGFGEVSALPPQVFDLSEGSALEGLGRAGLPVHNLPEVVFDLSQRHASPALELSLYLRSGVAGGELALDLFRLYAAVNQLELSHQGAGLTPAS